MQVVGVGPPSDPHMEIAVAPFIALLSLTATVFASLGVIVRKRGSRDIRLFDPPRNLLETPDDFPRQMALIDGISDGVIFSDRSGLLTYWNTAALRLHGYQKMEDVRRPLSEFRDLFVLTYPHGGIVPFDDWPLARVIRGEAVENYELELQRSNTGQRWTIRYSGTRIRLATGNDERFVITLQDVTDQRHAERALRQAADSKAILAAMVEQSENPIIGESLTGIITSWNRSAERVFGYRADEVIGQSVSLLVPPDRKHELCDFLNRLSEGKGIEHFESQRITKDGRLIDVALTISPVRDTTGRVIGASKIVRDITQLKIHVRALHDSEARLRHMANAMPQIVWTGDPEGRTTFVNERWYQYTGVASADDADLACIVHPEDRVRLSELRKQVTATGTLFSMELRMRPAAGGDYRWFLARAVPMRNPSGEIIEWFGTSTDIEDLKRVEALAKDNEAQLRTNHALLRTVVEGITDPVYVKDLDGKYLLANSALATALGKPAAQVIGATDEALRGIGEAAAVIEADRRILALEMPQTYEETVSTGAGVRHYLTTKASYYDADSRIAGTLGISRDITFRKRTEDALLASERHLRDVLDSLLVYVGVLRPGGRLSGLNRAAKQALALRGVRFEDVEGIALFDFSFSGITDDVRAALHTGVTRAALGEEVRIDSICIFDGTPRAVVDVVIAPMSTEDGRLSHLIVSAVDVTERELQSQHARDRQVELAHLDRLRTMGQMAAGLAHELNQPLGAITNYAGACQRLILSNRMPIERLAVTLREIQSEALRTGAIVQRLRGFVKKQKPQTVDADLNTLIKEALQLLSFELRQSQIYPRLLFLAETPGVQADPIQMKQVLVNLIRNALDAMLAIDAGLRSLVIETSLDAVSGNVRVAVEDCGCGVSPEDMTRLFDAFFTTKSDGMGIGLSLCRTIIEDHGGHLTAAANPSGGMTFSFTLLPALQRVGEGVLS